MIEPYFRSLDRNFTLLHGDCRKLLRNFDFKFNCILQIRHISCQKAESAYRAAKIVCKQRRLG